MGSRTECLQVNAAELAAALGEHLGGTGCVAGVSYLCSLVLRQQLIFTFVSQTLSVLLTGRKDEPPTSVVKALQTCPCILHRVVDMLDGWRR